MRRALVTGGTGMIGAHLCRRLHADGYAVSVLTRPGSNRLRLADVAADVTFVETPLTDAEGVARAVADSAPDVLYHLACTPFNPPTTAGETHIDVNVKGTLNLLEALRDRPCRLVYSGSAAEYAPGAGISEGAPFAPINMYGAVKACASILIDTFVRMHGLDAVRLIFFNIYGPWERPRRLVPSIILAALDGRPATIADGTVQREMLYVSDAVDALIAAAGSGVPAGTALHICSGKAYTVRETAKTILRLMGNPVELDERAARTRGDEIREMSGDNGYARRLIGWRPTISLEDGLLRCIEWYSAHRTMATAIP